MATRFPAGLLWRKLSPHICLPEPPVTLPTNSMPSLPLDPDQQRAVAHREGPCLVLAGPGSGKTRVIVERFLALMEDGIPPSRQLVLTYTRKAAAEMRERAEAAAGPFNGEPPLSNYHSFAGRVVREWGWLIGISPVFRIADSAERWLACQAVLGELKPRTLWNPLRPHDLVDPILDVIGKAKQELVTPERYSSWAAGMLEVCADPAERALLERHAEIADVYAALDQHYRRHAVLDHDDTILCAELLLREHEPARWAICGAIEQVMVDEYQDTNYAQARLVETLVEDHRNLLVVADDDQSIYKFRGASLANLDRFSRMYEGHDRVVLRRNFRSTPQIVAVAAQIIGGAAVTSRIAKELTAQRDSGPAVELWEADDERAECQAIAGECRALIDSGMRPASIAWLFRQHADMRSALAALREAGVPYQVQGGRGFFTTPEIKDLLALLRAAADPDDSQALLRCLHLPAWRVSNAGRLALVRATRDVDAPLRALIDDGTVEDLEASDREAARHCLADVVEMHAGAQREDVREIFYAALERSGFLGLLEQQTELARMQTGANLNKFGEMLEAFADWSDDRRLETALRYLEVLRNSKDADELAAIDPVEDGVVLSTAHSAKGLEWPVVFLSGCIDVRWRGRGGTSRLSLPDALVPESAPAGDGELDEERRLFYVAATRARDRLVFSHALRYPRSFRDEKPAAFLEGMTQLADPVVRRSLPPASPLGGRPPRAAGERRRERLHLGVSDVKIFKACPRRFEYRHRYKMPTVDSVQSWFGTLMHQVLQNAAMRRSAGESIGVAEVERLWDEAWALARGPKGAHPELREYGAEQLRRYIASPLWTEASITAVEESFVLALTHAEVHGRFDRIDIDEPTPPTCVDYKTSPPRDAAAVERDLQVRAYAVALSQQQHCDRVDVEMHYLQTGEAVRVEFDAKTLDRAFKNISAVTGEMSEAWRTGVFPARPSTWNCPRCEYRTVCDEGRAAEG